ncbi:MAG: HlyD family secretion protein [Deltaproteobacteria bacterium]|nr:HlyD family secretion protein [Deltaproteobacteria bacterium]
MPAETAEALKAPEPSLPSPHHTRRRSLYLAGAGAAALILTVWICLRWNHITENDAYVLADMVTISSRVDGWIAERRVTDGDTVRQGDTLVIIDQRSARLLVDELKSREASLRKKHEWMLVQLAVTEDSTEHAVAAARARHEEARAGMGISAAEMEQAQLDYKRNKPLAANDAISRKTWDETRTASQMAAEKHRLAQARVSESSANLADAITKRAEVTVLQKQLEELAHDIEQTRRQIGQKEVDLYDRTLRSPINGVVDQKFVEPGEYVIPGQRLLLMHDPQSVWIEVLLKETKLTDVRVGQPVEISVDAYPGRHFAGRVERVGNAATNQFALLPNPNPSGNFTKIAQRVPVRVKVDQPDGNPLRPGMMVEVDIDVSHR